MISIIKSLDQLEAAVATIKKSPSFVFDVETSGPDRDFPLLANVMWISFATKDLVCTIPIDHPNGDVLIEGPKRKKNKDTGRFDISPPVYDTPPLHLTAATVWPILTPLFHGPQTKIAHNALFDLNAVTKYVGQPKPPFGDSLVAHWILWNDHPTKGRKGLKEIVRTTWGQTWEGDVGKEVETKPFSQVAQYSLTDAHWAWVLWVHHLKEIESQEKVLFLFRLEMQIIEVILDMEQRGVLLDQKHLEQLDVDLGSQIEDLERQAHALVGRPFLLSSPKEKAEILYKERKLKPLKQTPKGAASVDQASLERYRGKDPLVDILLKHSEISKVHGTYVTPYLSGKYVIEGRLHPEFVQYGTTTGRFSSRNPNVQNIPRPDEGKEYATAIRSLFCAPENRVFVVSDWSQIEYRLLASLTKEPALVEAYKQGLDAHSATAAALFEKPITEVTKHERVVAKGGNFAVVYGSGPATLAASTGITVQEAGKFLQDFEERMPLVYAWKRKVIRRASDPNRRGVWTQGGRFRHLENLFNVDPWIQKAAERQAVNTVIQGTAADLMKEALLDIHWALQDIPEAFLVLTVHDEVVVECGEGDAQKVLDIVKAAMESPKLGEYYCPGVPLLADCRIVKKWSEGY